MEPERISEKNPQKKNWLFFAVGVAAGFVLCALVIFGYFCLNNGQGSDNSNSELTAITEFLNKEPDTKTEQKQNKTSDNESQNIAEEAIMDADTLTDGDYEAEELEEFEFAAEPDDDVTVWQEQMIGSRKVKVEIIASDSANSADIHEYVEVEQWNSPIKNKHSFQMKDNVLKITGFDIHSSFKIIYENGNYYLLKDNSRYLIKNNNKIEKTTEAKISSDDN